MKVMTESEWNALPQWQAVTYADSSRLFVGKTGGRWPKVYTEAVEVVPDEEAGR